MTRSSPILVLDPIVICQAGNADSIELMDGLLDCLLLDEQVSCQVVFADSQNARWHLLLVHWQGCFVCLTALGMAFHGLENPALTMQCASNQRWLIKK